MARKRKYGRVYWRGQCAYGDFRDIGGKREPLKAEGEKLATTDPDCAARLQTLDGGAPVSPYTVGRELGHGGSSMVERVYSHLGTVRHRSAVVEYPLATIEQIPDRRVRESFEGRLKALSPDH